jgi:glucosamine-6-phosphate isomerase
MQIKILETPEEAAQYAVLEWTNYLQKKPESLICMASGDSPKRTCELFCEAANRDDKTLKQFFLIGLDEWAGIPPDTPGSCYHDFYVRLIQPLQLSDKQYHFFNAMNPNPENECKKMDKIIEEKGGIDFMVVGIGLNGHIGFNEPGVNPDRVSHIIELDEITKYRGQEYFSKNVSLQKGITLGLKHVLSARKVIMLALGEKKAQIIKNAVCGEVTNLLPASYLQLHPESVIIMDKPAASLL